MNEEIFGIGGTIFILFFLSLITIVAVVVITQALKYARTRVMSRLEIARDEAYRKVAEEAVSVQKTISEDLSDIRTRIASIEKILREVE